MNLILNREFGQFFMSKKNKLLLGLCFLIISAIAILNFNNIFGFKEKDDGVVAQLLEESEIKPDSLIELSMVEKAIINAQKVSHESIDENVKGYVGNASDEYPTIMGSPQTEQEIYDWHRDNGYYLMRRFNAPEDEYASYDMDTLRRLKDSGDLHAYAYYARKLNDGTQDGYLKSREASMELAAMGSIEALHITGFLTKNTEGEFTGLSKRENELDYISLYKVAEMRGDRLPMIEAYSSIEFGRLSPLSSLPLKTTQPINSKRKNG
jgi:hypothetical protein